MMTNLGVNIFVAGVLLLVVNTCQAQFTKATIGVNGLTCSQCSRSVEVELKKLEFIKSVSMDLEHTEGVIYFKDKSRVDIKAIAKAVKNAGFSVRFLKAMLNTDQVVINDNCIKYRSDAYFLLRPVNGKNPLILQFIGKEYLPGKELRQYTLPEKVSCNGSSLYYADVL